MSIGQRVNIYLESSQLFVYLWLGEGYKSVMSEDLSAILVSATNWDNVSGMHNSFLELWRQIGFIGTMIISIWFLVVTIQKFKKSKFNNDRGYYACLSLFCFLLFGLWESSYGPYTSITTLVILRLALTSSSEQKTENFNR